MTQLRKKMLDELQAGNLHATFCGSRGRGQPPSATRWATSNGCPYRDLTEGSERKRLVSSTDM